MFTILIVLLIVTVAQAATGPGEFTCDPKIFIAVPRYDGPTVRTFICNEDTAERGDTCVLWRVTESEEDNTITYWYMCNEFNTYLPVISR